MNEQSTSRYANWVSPISACQVAAGSNSLAESICADGCIYWLERRPDQGGRTTIMRYRDGAAGGILPLEYNCRSRVHEYGGGAYRAGGDQVFFVNDSDQQIYLLDNTGIRPVTAAASCRFADIRLDLPRNRLFAVREDHSDPGMPANSLVCIAIDSGLVRTLCDVHDFYSSPRYNASTGELAWLSWDFPAMPWDHTALHVATLDDAGRVVARHVVADAAGVSIAQPEWHGKTLYYVSDQSGWWNLYRHHDGGEQALLPMAAEFALPHWVFAQSSYCFMGDTLLASCNQQGRQRLLALDLASLEHRLVGLDYSQYTYLSAAAGTCCAIVASPSSSPQVIALDAACRVSRLTGTEDDGIDPACIAVAMPRTFTSRHGDDIHALYYAPVNPAYSIEPDMPPSLIVLSHGGPTGQCHDAFDLKKQFWTSRGFAILDVNYSGSTGYGRRYRQRLAGNWGIRDVSDVCDAAIAAAAQGLADPDRLIIKGSSAGGYTTLAALTFAEVFCAGASYYGISDLESLANDTHKFEARYLDTLVGEYPRDAAAYRERSPIHFADRLGCPVIFLQGEEDRVVPRSQAERMIAALRSKGIAVAYRLYPGEQHGFRRAGTIIDALESELCFYIKLFIDAGADCELEIDNLSTAAP